MNALNWFEIPVGDIQRATKFYNTVLGADMQPMQMGGSWMTMLPSAGDGVGGALTQADGFAPSRNGTIVYLNGGADLSVMLARVEKAGGSVLEPKTDIGDGMGFFAIFLDTEGNKVGFHSMG